MPAKARADRPPKSPNESAEAMWLVEWATKAAAGLPGLGRMYAVPNGGYRSRRTAGRMKAEGLRASVPDYCLPVARSGFHALYVELKSTTGALTPEQREELLQLRRDGNAACACWGWRSAAEVIKAYLEGVIADGGALPMTPGQSKAWDLR